MKEESKLKVWERIFGSLPRGTQVRMTLKAQFAYPKIYVWGSRHSVQIAIPSKIFIGEIEGKEETGKDSYYIRWIADRRTADSLKIQNPLPFYLWYRDDFEVVGFSKKMVKECGR